MPNRLVNKADFERLLGARPWARSAHFAVHHVSAAPLRPIRPTKAVEADKLSTGPAPSCPPPVDDLPTAWWLGCVVPKRHARRAVTRSLLKRQVRGAFERHEAALPQGLWLVRLRQAFAVAEFPSARSAALQLAARTELDQLFTRTAR
ncbi:MAG: ribonuclease P protein component [Rubrivivax sp.]|nr:ribonuclease P protein component [Rubrivivax sp.]